MIWFTGFEHGNGNLENLTIVSSSAEGLTSTAGQVYQGSYAYKIETVNGIGEVVDVRFYFEQTLSEVYVTFTFKLGATGSTDRRRVYLGNYYLLYSDANSRFDLYSSGGSLLAAGVAGVIGSGHHVVELHLSSAGFQVRIDGVSHINYTASLGVQSLTYVRFYITATYVTGFYIDNLGWSSDNWIGNLKIATIVPEGDVVSGWDTTGATRYGVIDEIPPNDSDYIYTTVSGAENEVSMATWDASEKTILGLNVWARARKDTADEEYVLDFGVNSNGTEYGTNTTLSTAFKQYYAVVENDPDTSAPWDQSGINNVKIKVASNL